MLVPCPAYPLPQSPALPRRAPRAVRGERGTHAARQRRHDEERRAAAARAEEERRVAADARHELQVSVRRNLSAHTTVGSAFRDCFSMNVRLRQRAFPLQATLAALREELGGAEQALLLRGGHSAALGARADRPPPPPPPPK